jgi:hypothetical protein
VSTIQPSSTARELVRKEVHKVLDRSKEFARLSPDEREGMASAMVEIGEYLARDPGWLDAEGPPEATELAEALGPVEDLKGRLAKAPGQVGQEFEAGAVRQGVEQFRNLVDAVDFPDFVSGLIQGVFQAIVDASIQQMEAYSELLAATAKSVGEFANDHISDDQAREQVAARFPSAVRIERTSEGGTRLATSEGEGSEDGAAQKPLQDYVKSNETIDFTDPESERKFVLAAKLEMARQRQKLMALMVMLGINRIVVTDGRINAKVIFDMRASDYAQRQAQASLSDRQQSASNAAVASWTPWGAGGASSSRKHVTTVKSSVDDTSESKAEMKAQLTGDVRVNFRSETLPPERMLDALGFEQNFLTGLTGPAPSSAGTPQEAKR